MLHPTKNQVETLVELANGSLASSIAWRNGGTVQTVRHTAELAIVRILSAAYGDGVQLEELSGLGERSMDFYVRVCRVAERRGYVISHTNMAGYREFRLSNKLAITGRRREVLIGIAKGHSFRAIACDLGISEDTVKTHSANLRKDLGATNGAHAVSIAFICGLLNAEDLK